jgi:DNA-3-methyladenine glycosylase I
MKTTPKSPKTAKTRCRWVPVDDPDYIHYHDKEWGRPVHDDRLLFEMLILEGAQAGLSWSTILNKRDGYRLAFDGFDPVRVERYGDRKLDELLANPGIVRNRLKVRGTVTNARAFLAVADEYGSFDGYLWTWVDGKPIVNAPETMAELPARTDLSDRLGKDLKRRGFTFVGSTIVYSYLQAVGLVNDHLVDCPWRSTARRAGR